MNLHFKADSAKRRGKKMKSRSRGRPTRPCGQVRSCSPTRSLAAEGVLRAKVSTWENRKLWRQVRHSRLGIFSVRRSLRRSQGRRVGRCDVMEPRNQERR